MLTEQMGANREFSKNWDKSPPANYISADTVYINRKNMFDSEYEEFLYAYDCDITSLLNHFNKSINL